MPGRESEIRLKDMAKTFKRLAQANALFVGDPEGFGGHFLLSSWISRIRACGPLAVAIRRRRQPRAERCAWTGCRPGRSRRQDVVGLVKTRINEVVGVEVGAPFRRETNAVQEASKFAELVETSVFLVYARLSAYLPANQTRRRDMKGYDLGGSEENKSELTVPQASTAACYSLEATFPQKTLFQ